ncbi:MAG: hypothetical protein IPK98_16630 [Chloracidobacterium sp.]|nr:hypothetical protein [Chloracidobacterium sp.]
MFLLFGVVLCFAGFGIAAWQINAAGASQNGNAQQNGEQAGSGKPSATPATGKSTTRVEGIYRGVILPTKADISPPLRDMKPIAAYKTAKRPNEERDAIPRSPDIPKELWKNDPVVQSFLGDQEIPAPIASFDGSPTNPAGVAPPDPNGDVGPNHVVTMYNLQFQIFNKSGTSFLGLPIQIQSSQGLAEPARMRIRATRSSCTTSLPTVGCFPSLRPQGRLSLSALRSRPLLIL